MAKPLVFLFQDHELSFTLNKVDRSKLYGYKEVEALDENGHVCELATLADDGRTVVGLGGTGIGYVSADLEWCDKTMLKPVDLEGNEITPVSSSFGAPIELVRKATLDDYLDHKIRLLYHLTTEGDVAELLDELVEGTIYSFPYSYRGGLQADAGFLLTGDEGKIFLAVGDPTEVRFVGLQQTAAVVQEDSEDDETDLMDFDMI